MIGKVATEALGTGLLVAIVVGSGVMAERLCGGNMAVALLANTLATGCGLAVLIVIFGPVSGAQFNPVVTLVELGWRRVDRTLAPAFVLAQLVGGLLAHAMFAHPRWQASARVRSGGPQWLSEAVATFGWLHA